MRGSRASASFAVLIAALSLAGGCSRPDAQPEGGVSEIRSCPADSGTTVTTLGTAGGPILRRARSQPANLLTVGGESYLIDAGDGAASQLTKAGVPIPGIRHVFLTHLHADHVAGLAPLLLFAWTSAAAHPMTVYGPPGTQQLVEAGLSYIETPVNIHRLQYPPVPVPAELFSAEEPAVAGGLEPTLIYEDELVGVYAVENSHYTTLPAFIQPYGADRSYSYRFDTPDRSVVFSGDTGQSDALAALSAGADVLVIEVIDLERQLDFIRSMTNLPDEQLTMVIDHMAKEHISPEQIGVLATQASVGQVVLTHIVPGLDDETDASPYLDDVRTHYAGPVHIASDFDCF
ncbi:MAG: MBL fold metallo-hydrolase [Hyphomonadaceae bacterium]|nr:MBL fold metallo-hydrolase [Hyphomonadaceae bacterium]